EYAAEEVEFEVELRQVGRSAGRAGGNWLGPLVRGLSLVRHVLPPAGSDGTRGRTPLDVALDYNVSARACKARRAFRRQDCADCPARQERRAGFRRRERLM